MGNKGLMEETVEKHESYGMAVINRTQSSGTTLFGSLMNHHSFITLSIAKGQVRRSLSNDWYAADSSPLIEIEMSHTQFAQLITSPGLGDGVPCTIRAYDHKLMEKCPAPEPIESKFKDDLKKTTASTVTELKALSAQLSQALLPGEKALNKKELKVLLQGIQSAVQSVTDSIPFVEQSFSEEVEDQLNMAKGEMEAVANALIHRTGLNALAKANQMEIGLPEFAPAQLSSGEKK